MSAEHCAIPAHPSILLLNSRPWLYEIQASTLDDITDEQLTTALLGDSVDVCWLQGCWELGPFGRQHDLSDPGRRQHFQHCLADFSEADCIGSPYAITRYTCNSELGSEASLANFRSRLASRGIALMVDFVPNHMARDSPWIDIPDLFIRGRDGKVACGKDPYSGDWTDTAQLNYWSETCRVHMLKQLLDVAERCDGMRVDMAMLCVNDVIERTWGSHLREQGYRRPDKEFWVWALPKLRERHPNFLLVAECYEYDEILPSGTMRELLRQGFNSAYDKVLYDRLTEGHMDKLRGHLFDSPDMREGRLCHFTENHDEDRTAEHFGARALAATVASLTLPGPRLFMWGQDLGLCARLAVHLRRARREAPDATLSAVWPRLLAALPHCRGHWQLGFPMEGDDSWRFVSWGWKLDCEASEPVVASIVVVNFTDSVGWATLKLATILPGSPRSDSIALWDAVSDETFTRSYSALRDEGLVVGLQGFQSHLLLCSFQ